MDKYWRFSEIPHIEEVSFNKVLERFYNFGIPGLVRENIQNSLDAKISGSKDPVIVNIETGSVDKTDIPGVEEIINRINALEGKNRYSNETIYHMQNKVQDNNCHYISFEDSNTKGLKGALNGQSDNREDSWSAYAYTKGVHIEDSDSDFEKSRGGSHGIGKIASNSASDLHIMYFANCDEDGNQHLGGTVQLIEHNYSEKCYRATGYFTDVKSEKFYPFENKFHQIFKKDTRGLRIVIPYLREQFYNEDEIIKSVCDNFFIAILEERLVVIINNNEINKDSIVKYIRDERYYADQNVSDIKNDFTPLYLSTFLNNKVQKIEIRDKREAYNFNLYFNYDEEIQKGRVAIIRTIGMKIEDKKVTGYVNKPFNAILVPESVKEDEFLKSLENESHTELSFNHIKDKEGQSNAKRFINNLSKRIGEVIEKHIRANNPTDGKIDTSDIIYSVENNFKTELKERTNVVKLKNKDGKEKSIVKIEDRKPRENKEAKDNDKPQNEKERKPRKHKEVNKDLGDGKKKTLLKLDPSAVMRLVSQNTEHIMFDISDSSEVKRAKTCDISFAVVDGMGVEHMNEFNIEDSYKKIVDVKTGKELKVVDKAIVGASISKGVIKIKAQMKKQNSKTLKFVYLLEV